MRYAIYSGKSLTLSGSFSILARKSLRLILFLNSYNLLIANGSNFVLLFSVLDLESSVAKLLYFSTVYEGKWVIITRVMKVKKEKAAILTQIVIVWL